MMRNSIALESIFKPASVDIGLLKRITPTPEQQSSWRRWFDVLVANQERRAWRVTAPYLARECGSTLKDIGFNADQIAAIRREAGDLSPIGL